MTSGISAVGVALPRTRLLAEEIDSVWLNDPEPTRRRRGVMRRAVCDADMDAITLAAEAASDALSRYDGPLPDAVLLGTQTNPYLSRSGAAVIADILGMPRTVFALDVQFGGKSGSGALLAGIGLVRGEMAQRVLVVGADTLGPHVSPGDLQEYESGSGAVALVIDNVAGLAEYQGCASTASDTPDGFRLDGERWIRTGGSTMAATHIGLKSHVSDAFTELLARCDIEKSSFAQVALSQTSPASVHRMAAAAALAKDQYQWADVSSQIGDIGAASCLLSLVAVLERARAGDRIGLLSYGRGAGSDAISFIATGTPPGSDVERLLATVRDVTYAEAARLERRYDTASRMLAPFE